MKTPTEMHPNYHEIVKEAVSVEGIKGKDWSKKFFMLRMKTGGSLIMQLHVGDVRSESTSFRACRVFEMKYNESQFYPYVIPINPFLGFMATQVIVFEWKDVAAVISSMDSTWDDQVIQWIEQSESDLDDLSNVPTSDLIN